MATCLLGQGIIVEGRGSPASPSTVTAANPADTISAAAQVRFPPSARNCSSMVTIGPKGG